MKRSLLASLITSALMSGCVSVGNTTNDNENDNNNNNNTQTSTGSEGEGLWNGTTSDGRTTNGIVLEDGSYWIVYSAQGNDQVIGGAIQGSSTAQNGIFTTSNSKDFNLEGGGISDITLSGTYVAHTSLAGTLGYSGGNQLTFTSSYDSDYELTPSLALVAGSYSGSAYTSLGAGAVNITIASNGSITGSGTGCTFSGNTTPRSDGNVYNVTVTFNGGSCANGTDTVTGIAYYDAATMQLSSAALNNSRTDGFLFAGLKQ